MHPVRGVAAALPERALNRADSAFSCNIQESAGKYSVESVEI